jgi:hypothetical protein
MYGPRTKARTSTIATMTDVAKPSWAPTPIGCHRKASATTPKNDQAIQRKTEAASELFLREAREGLDRLVGERSRIDKAHGTPLFLEAGTQLERAVVTVLVGAVPHVAAGHPDLQGAELHRREVGADTGLVVVIVTEHGDLRPEIAEPE